MTQARPLVVIASISAKPGRTAELGLLLKTLLHPTLAEPGCLRYEMNESIEGESWVFTEQWQSEAHWQQHQSSLHMTRFKAAAGDLIAEMHLFVGQEISTSAKSPTLV